MRKWKDIPGYEGLYRVSNKGDIYSILSQKILKPGKSYGYNQVVLTKKGKRTTIRIHRIVGDVFIANKYNKSQINHKNGIRDDNRVENLEWCNNGENQIHAYKFLDKVNPLKGKTGYKNHLSKKVYRLTLDNVFIDCFGSTYEAERCTGVNHRSISKVCNGKRGKAGGFKWHY